MNWGSVVQMGKTRQKNRNEVEYYKGIVRNQKSEIKQLRKRLKQLEKQEHNYGEIITEIVENSLNQKETELIYCDECKKGILSILDLKYIKYTVCDKCEYKTKI